MPERPPLHRALRPLIAVASLGLTVWLMSCAQTGLGNLAATTPAAAVAAKSAPSASEPTPAASETTGQPTLAPTDAKRLTELVVRALPMGSMTQTFLDKDPDWPLEERAAKVETAQLQCLRQRLSPAGFQENRGQAVAEFIKRYPDQVQDAIDVLEQGGAEVMGSAIQTGLNEQRTGRNIEFEDVMPRFTPAQISKFVDLSLNDKYKPLRELLIGGNNFPSGKNGGATVGKRLGIQLMLDAMDHCHVPMSALR